MQFTVNLFVHFNLIIIMKERNSFMSGFEVPNSMKSSVIRLSIYK